jgi:hypothetical protein
MFENEGFHWRNNIFWKRLEDGSVRIAFFATRASGNIVDGDDEEPTRELIIPAAEWASIVNAVSGKGEREAAASAPAVPMPSSLYCLEHQTAADPTGCVAYFPTAEDRDAFMAWIAAGAPAAEVDLHTALEESVALQSHYAGSLNDYDGGDRLTFPNADAWIAHLRVTGALK